MQNIFWKDNRVLVTGSSGFVGRHLCMYLRSVQANALGLSRNPVASGEIKIELTNYPALEKIFTTFRPTICFHLASEALVEQGQSEPYKTFHNNLLSTLNIVELCRIHDVRRVIVASTAHVYGNVQSVYNEESPARPSRPYETSKTCTDLIAQSYADSFNLSVLIPRFVNIYGPGDLNFSRVIPKTIRSVLLGERPTMWGGTAEREYLYIDDAIDAYVALGQMSDGQIGKNRIYNFGTQDAITVEKLIHKVISLSRISVSIDKISGGRREENPVQRISWDKSRKDLHWKPGIPLDEGLMRTIAWYKTYFLKSSA